MPSASLAVFQLGGRTIALPFGGDGGGGISSSSKVDVAAFDGSKCCCLNASTLLGNKKYIKHIVQILAENIISQWLI